jgi:hypothetical protein
MKRWEGCIEIPDGSTPDEIAAAAAKEAKFHLFTYYPGTTYNEITNEGKVYAGFHIVGTFMVENTMENKEGGN